MTAAAKRSPALVELIIELFLAEGRGHESNQHDAELHRQRIAWEWESGQWVMLTDKAGRLSGFMSYYRVSPKLFKELRDKGLWAIARRKNRRAAADLTQGPHVYIATAVVAPWAPGETYFRLYYAMKSQNDDALSCGAHLRKRNGKVRWIERRFASADNRHHATLLQES